MRTGIKPGNAPRHQFHAKILAFKIGFIDIRNFKLASGGRLHLFRDFKHVRIIEIKPGYRKIRLRVLRFLFNADCPMLIIELNNAIALRIRHVITKHRSSVIPAHRALQHLSESVPEEQVVTKNQTRVVALDEVLAERKRLSEPRRLFLDNVSKGAPPLRTILQKFLEKVLLIRGRNNGNLTDTGLDQNRYGVKNHRFIVNRHQLLADAARERIKTRSGSAGKHNAAPFILVVFHNQLLQDSSFLLP